MKTMCGHCFRPSVALVRYRGFWRTVFFMPPVMVPVCSTHLLQYGKRRGR